MNIIDLPLDVIVIGGGQAGLACGWHLKQQGVNFLIVDEQERPGGNWRNYYDSLQLFSPAEYSALPGTPFPASAKHYPFRDEVVNYLEGYADQHQLPLRLGTSITNVMRARGIFMVQSADGEILTAKAVVVASGGFSQPFTPAVKGLERFMGRRLHSSEYRRPEEYAGQRVVVVGAANSAVQIAYELAQVAQVTLATRETIRFFPQRILGLDFHAWLRLTRLERTGWLNDQSTPVLDDGKYRNALKSRHFFRKPMFEQVTPEGVVWPGGSTVPVDSLIFATGFRPKVDFLKSLPAVDQEGHVLQRNGQATQVQGLYFVGLPKQRNFASATLRGVGPDVAHFIPTLLQHLRSVDDHRCAD